MPARRSSIATKIGEAPTACAAVSSSRAALEPDALLLHESPTPDEHAAVFDPNVDAESEHRLRRGHRRDHDPALAREPADRSGHRVREPMLRRRAQSDQLGLVE